MILLLGLVLIAAGTLSFIVGFVWAVINWFFHKPTLDAEFYMFSGAGSVLAGIGFMFLDLFI